MTSQNKDTYQHTFSFGEPKIDWTRPGYDDKVAMLESIDFKSAEGRKEYKHRFAESEQKHVDLLKNNFLKTTVLYINNLKLQRADLERKHTEKLVELREEKKQLEDGIAKINELILNARKDGDDKWERHKSLMLN